MSHRDATSNGSTACTRQHGVGGVTTVVDVTDRRLEPDLEVLFAEEYPLQVRTAYLIVGDGDLARELAQEAFARLVARWAKVSRYDRPGAWLRLVTVRLALRARDRRVREGGSFGDAGPAGALGAGGQAADRSAAVEHDDLLAALGQLSRQQRAVVVLHHLHDLPTDEVADLLGIAPATVRVHLSRARAHLAAALREEVPDAEH